MVIFFDQYLTDTGRNFRRYFNGINWLDRTCRRDCRLQVHADDFCRFYCRGLSFGLLGLIVLVAAERAGCDDDGGDSHFYLLVDIHSKSPLRIHFLAYTKYIMITIRLKL